MQDFKSLSNIELFRLVVCAFKEVRDRNRDVPIGVIYEMFRGYIEGQWTPSEEQNHNGVVETIDGFPLGAAVAVPSQPAAPPA